MVDEVDSRGPENQDVDAEGRIGNRTTKLFDKEERGR
jgi:hypothetical protein